MMFMLLLMDGDLEFMFRMLDHAAVVVEVIQSVSFVATFTSDKRR